MRSSVLVCALALTISCIHAHAEQWLEARRDAHLTSLLDFLRIPSISSDPDGAESVHKAANFLLNFLLASGLSNARLLRTNNTAPAVFASHTGAPDLPTLLIYGHYDVQPSAPDSAWVTPAFEPTLRSGRIYARGASDDKGPVLSAARAAAAYAATQGVGSGVSVKLIFEGAEEVGSPGLGEILTKYSKCLAADFAFSADGGQVDRETPGLCVGLRGSVALEVAVEGARDDAHSGTYGGGVRNPLHALSQLLGGLWDKDGRVDVPAFYHGVDSPTQAEILMAKMFPRTPSSDLDAIGARAEFGERGFSYYERTWLRPALDVVGMWGGHTGSGMKTVLPARAYAKLSARLVGRQEPHAAAEALRDVLLARGAKLAGVRVNVTLLPWRASPYSVSVDTAGNRAAGAVLEELYGREAVPFRLGGSIPFFHLAKQILNVDTTMFAIAYADENVHAPNENWELKSAARMETAYLRLFRWFETENSAKKEL